MPQVRHMYVLQLLVRPHVRYICVQLPLVRPHVSYTCLCLHIAVGLKGRTTQI